MEKYIAPELKIIELDAEVSICLMETSDIEYNDNYYDGEWD